MSTKKNVANAVGGKTARACDSCVKKRARWYCAEDDAFICQACDASVHSANPIARKHERVRLKTASFKPPSTDNNKTLVPSWHRGFTRKSRTPRKIGKPTRNVTVPLVPEVEENEEEDQLFYSNCRVPIYDPLACYNGDVGHSLHGFLPSDMDLEDFAADVESLLGRGLENESFAMEGLGLVDYRNNNFAVKAEEEEKVEECNNKVFANINSNDDDDDDQIDLEREPFELNFDYDDSPATCVKEEMETSGDDDAKKNQKKRKILLSLDYEAVITAWATHGTSPWTTGDRPDFDPAECLPDCVGTYGTEGHNYAHQPYGDFGGMGAHPATVNGGREARVSRYKEKRRTRLFSKKIRYEVRKLNAEKRPRMKGRFVKKASFAGPPPFPLFNNSTK